MFEISLERGIDLPTLHLWWEGRPFHTLFLPARRYAGAVLAVIVCVYPSVCPSVCHKSEFY